MADGRRFGRAQNDGKRPLVSVQGRGICMGWQCTLRCKGCTRVLQIFVITPGESYMFWIVVAGQQVHV